MRKSETEQRLDRLESLSFQILMSLLPEKISLEQQEVKDVHRELCEYFDRYGVPDVDCKLPNGDDCNFGMCGRRPFSSVFLQIYYRDTFLENG